MSTTICPSASTSTCARSIGRGAGPSKLIASTVVTTAVARTLEFVLACLPIWCAAQMRTSRIDHEQAVRRLSHPDALLLLPLGVDAQCVVARCTDLESAGWLSNRSRQEKPHEHQEARQQEPADAIPNNPATRFVDRRLRERFDDHRRFRRGPGSRRRRPTRRWRRCGSRWLLGYSYGFGVRNSIHSGDLPTESRIRKTNNYTTPQRIATTIQSPATQGSEISAKSIAVGSLEERRAK